MTEGPTVWGPLTCPNCGYQPGDDTETYTSGGGWERDHGAADGAYYEELHCPLCRELVARDETVMDR